MAGPTQPRRRPDDGLGAWRPILRELGPLPARMGRPRFTTRIHLTSRNLVSLRIHFGSADGGLRSGRLPGVERDPLLQDLVNAPREHPRHDQPTNLWPSSFRDAF